MNEIQYTPEYSDILMTCDNSSKDDLDDSDNSDIFKANRDDWNDENIEKTTTIIKTCWESCQMNENGKLMESGWYQFLKNLGIPPY